MTAITLGRGSPRRLNATYPRTRGAPSSCAYLVLLRAEITRFTPPGAHWPKGKNFQRAPGGLVSVAL